MSRRWKPSSSGHGSLDERVDDGVCDRVECFVRKTDPLPTERQVVEADVGVLGFPLLPQRVASSCRPRWCKTRVAM